MKTNAEAITLIKEFEGLKLKPYADLGGKITIGWGHLIKAGEKFTSITTGQAEAIFLKDLAEAEAIVKRTVRVTLSVNQFSALVALAFNIPKSFGNTTLVEVLNAVRFDDAPEQILRWHRMGKKPVKGLIRRRAAEAMLFVS
jgi:lysozyme